MEDLFALLIPILAVSIPIVAIWTRHKQRLTQMELDAQTLLNADKSTQYSKTLRELEARVRVLERIVTDRGYDVASQIEALRDDRPMHDRNKAETL